MRIGSVKRPLPNSGPMIVCLMDRRLVPTTTGGSSASPRAMSNLVDLADPLIHSQTTGTSQFRKTQKVSCIV